MLGDGGAIEAVWCRGQGSLPLTEAMLMAADAPLLEFVRTADGQRFRLLVERGGMAGLVTLSDLQRLPVYSVLFGLVLATEMLLVDWVRRRSGGDDEVWLGHLRKDQRGRVESWWSKAREANVAVDRLSVASFGHERTAAEGLGLFDGAADRLDQLRRVEGLRHQVAHAAEIAPTADRAMALPALARDVLMLIDWLHLRIQDLDA